jgi:hypothetical protein
MGGLSLSRLPFQAMTTVEAMDDQHEESLHILRASADCLLTTIETNSGKT